MEIGEIDPRADEKLHVEFRMESVKDEAASEQAGHPVFKDVPFVKIQVPGDPTMVIDTVAKEHHKRRFPRHWMHFEQYQNQAPVVGTPLTEWAAVTRSQADTLKSLGVLTVEQLADLPDTAVQRIGMGGEQLRVKARAWLKQASGAAPSMAEAARMAELEESNRQMQAQIAELMGKLNDVPRRGRPPKEG